SVQDRTRNSTEVHSRSREPLARRVTRRDKSDLSRNRRKNAACRRLPAHERHTCCTSTLNRSKPAHRARREPGDQEERRQATPEREKTSRSGGATTRRSAGKARRADELIFAPAGS